MERKRLRSKQTREKSSSYWNYRKVWWRKKYTKEERSTTSFTWALRNCHGAFFLFQKHPEITFSSVSKVALCILESTWSYTEDSHLKRASLGCRRSNRWVHLSAPGTSESQLGPADNALVVGSMPRLPVELFLQLSESCLPSAESIIWSGRSVTVWLRQTACIVKKDSKADQNRMWNNKKTSRLLRLKIN